MNFRLMFLCVAFLALVSAAHAITVEEGIANDPVVHIVPPEDVKFYRFMSANGEAIEQYTFKWTAVKNPKYAIVIYKIYQNGELTGEREYVEINDLAYLTSEESIEYLASDLQRTAEIWEMQLIIDNHDEERFKELLFDNSGYELIPFAGYSDEHERARYVRKN